MSKGPPRPEPSPQLGFGFDSHPDDADKPRSRSQRLLDKLPSSVSEHIRRPSRSPDGIGAGITQAGLVLGSTGSEYLINRSSQQIKEGTKAFLFELNRLVGDARVESSKRAVKRVNTDLVKGTIQLQDDAASEREVDAIIDAEENPFDPAVESAAPTSPVDSDKANEYFIEDIDIYHHDHLEKLFMRARLDSGMEDNAISEEKAHETGFEIEPYTGRDIIVGNGDTFRPVGYIELQFHFQKVQAAKTWKLRFLVIPGDPPFDVAFGRNFIFKAKLFVRPSEALPMEYKRLSPREEAELRARTAHRDQHSSSRQSYQDTQYSSRRKPTDKSGSRRAGS